MEILDDNLKRCFKEVQGKTTLMKGQKSLFLSTTQEELTEKNNKYDNGTFRFKL